MSETPSNTTPHITVSRKESICAVVYFLIYLAYLFANPESEIVHWVSLVFLPLAGLFIVRKAGNRGIGSVLASVGLRRGNLTSWVSWACVAGLAVSALQLLLSRQAGEILAIIASGKVLYLFPMSFLLMFLTAGFTEEFFFRGVLLTRIDFLLRSKLLAILVSSILFGVYHLPYAYLNPNWPSAGDWGAAWSSSLIQGIPGGLILGSIYIFSGRNLLACIITHSLINALPAMSLIRFGGS